MTQTFYTPWGGCFTAKCHTTPWFTTRITKTNRNTKQLRQEVSLRHRIHHIGKNEYNHRVKDSIISWLCNDVDSNCLGLPGGHFYFQLLQQYLALHRSISFYNQQREQERRKQQRLKTWAWPHLTWGTYLVRKKVKGLKGK